MLSELEFGSHFYYWPMGRCSGRTAEQSRTLMRCLKEERFVRRRDGQVVEASIACAQRVAESLSSGPLSRLFENDPVLVPVPRSGIRGDSTIWPARNIAHALVAQGLGSRVLEAVWRRVPIRKSAWAGQDRPGPREQLETLDAAPIRPDPSTSFLLVDDVVTRGSTFLGTAWRLEASVPGARISAFAMMNTPNPEHVEPVPEILEDPFVSAIRFVDRGGGFCSRIPR